MILYVWYDNEFGYSSQVVRTVQYLSGIEYPTYPQIRADVDQTVLVTP